MKCTKLSCENTGSHGVIIKKDREFLCDVHFFEKYPEQQKLFSRDVTDKLMNEYREVLTKLSKS